MRSKKAGKGLERILIYRKLNIFLLHVTGSLKGGLMEDAAAERAIETMRTTAVVLLIPYYKYYFRKMYV